ncbi:MAG: TIGR01777 family protein [Bradymonadales bacterium]|nr:MAG: TIGR01777 family protein [Bradymonadales bacterium]
MKILITGGSGLVGRKLIDRLEEAGHDCRILSRSPGEKRIQWDPDAEVLKAGEIEAFDGVIHLAGENIASGRWTENAKRRIYDSRIKGSELLSRTIQQLENPPQFFISASAIGYYGNRGNERLTEESPAGQGFLAKTCVDWEASVQGLKDRGLRVCWLRIGVVLSPDGGALQKMLLPFKLGLGGRLGDGKQFWSWIDIEDLVRSLEYLAFNERLEGVFNGTAPEALPQAEFGRILSKKLKRPAILPAPAWGLKLLLGEMAEALLLSSARVEPTRLIQNGFQFKYPRLEDSLEHLLRS